MQHFHFNMTEEEAKFYFLKLSKRLHPDKNNARDANSQFDEMKKEYDDWLAIKRHWKTLKKHFGTPQVIIREVVKKVPVYYPQYIERQPQPIDPRIMNTIEKLPETLDKGIEAVGAAMNLVSGLTKAFKQGGQYYRQVKKANNGRL